MAIYARKGQLKGISRVIEQIREQYRFDEKREYSEAVKDWENIVGPDLAKHTKPIKIENGSLVIGVEGSAWSQEISFMKNAILQKINTRLGRRFLKSVKTRILDEKKG
ncbi:MAG TPA: DUF721 domain-containing protein [bacterium]|nr:DUF721 domain-containing protein [bacterium]